jgi:hypothetical protein
VGQGPEGGVVAV